MRANEIIARKARSYGNRKWGFPHLFGYAWANASCIR